MDVHGWTAAALAGRYVALGTASLAVLAVVYCAAIVRARARVRGAEMAG